MNPFPAADDRALALSRWPEIKKLIDEQEYDDAQTDFAKLRDEMEVLWDRDHRQGKQRRSQRRIKHEVYVLRKMIEDLWTGYRLKTLDRAQKFRSLYAQVDEPDQESIRYAAHRAAFYLLHAQHLAARLTFLPPEETEE